MDKRELIARAAQEPEDRLLLARVLDKYEQTERRSIPASTGFLSPREQVMAVSLLNAAGVREGYILDGGYEGAERKVLSFLPDWAQEDGEALAFLRARFRGADSALTHRDILGSLMGQGITRERVGDILLSDHSADVVVAPSLAEFLLQNWDSAGRVGLEVSRIGREELTAPGCRSRRSGTLFPPCGWTRWWRRPFPSAGGRLRSSSPPGRWHWIMYPVKKGTSRWRRGQ